MSLCLKTLHILCLCSVCSTTDNMVIIFVLVALMDNKHCSSGSRKIYPEILFYYLPSVLLFPVCVWVPPSWQQEEALRQSESMDHLSLRLFLLCKRKSVQRTQCDSAYIRVSVQVYDWECFNFSPSCLVRSPHFEDFELYHINSLRFNFFNLLLLCDQGNHTNYGKDNARGDGCTIAELPQQYSYTLL